MNRIACIAILTSLTLPLLGSSPSLAQTPYLQTNLVSDQVGHARVYDPNLVNPWGISMSGGSPFWISNNHTDTSTLYNTAGNIIPLVVSIPGGAPTGQVFNAKGADFKGDRFIFASESGFITGWQQSSGTTAKVRVDHSAGADHSIYKGLGLNNSTLYAADFHNGAIDVFDNGFNFLKSVNDASVPAGFAPFNVQTLSNGKLYVTYAKQKPTKDDDEHGPGNGFVDVYDPTAGSFSRLISNGALNSPWGLAIAPSNFGQQSGDLLVGNFGDGLINAFKLDGTPDGSLVDAHGNPIAIDGLWGLTFGNGGNGGAKDKLYFTAGPDEETHGLFGSLQAVPEPGIAVPFLFSALTAGLFLRRRRS